MSLNAFRGLSCITSFIIRSGEKTFNPFQDEAEAEAHAHLEKLDTNDLFLHDEKLWRPGGSLGWQSRKKHALNGGWADTTLAPDAVIDFFSRN